MVTYNNVHPYLIATREINKKIKKVFSKLGNDSGDRGGILSKQRWLL
jgi:hypothetical protein